jgi:hypothetical protein
MAARYRRRRRPPRWVRRLRRWVHRNNGRMTGAAVACGLLLAFLVHHAAAAPATARTVPATVAAAPGGSSYTPATWARALLRSLGDPRTGCDLAAVTAWESAEGGNWGDAAQYNPLNTTQTEPGSYAVNSAGVQAFTSWRSGFAATITVINNGLYGPILAALAAGDNAQAVADAVTRSHWGTGQFEVEC